MIKMLPTCYRHLISRKKGEDVYVLDIRRKHGVRTDVF